MVTASSTPLLPQTGRKKPKPTYHHILSLLLSTLLLSLSGYLLSSTTSSLADILHLTQSTLGLTLLSISTTLPEKLIAFKAGRKSQTGVLVANTVGSNVFLGTLVLGIVWVVEGDIGARGGQGGLWVDAWVGVAASGVLGFVVWGSMWRKWMGVLMLGTYIVYIASVFLRGEAL
jgi:Ca2+/Na+ antiporter